ncbi:MAG: GntR family transcriptional regulator [Betaproteobacteria bacterium]|nr:GntR family transcriptional regulator [Betaproteobacteria bacterium]
MLRIDLASSVPVYEQAADGLRAGLVAGTFKPGARLPAVRALAIDLGVHHNTVAQTDRQIATEGGSVRASANLSVVSMSLCPGAVYLQWRRD